MAIPALLLMACSEMHVDQMNRANLTGEQFNKRLARDYRDLANYEAYQMYDWPSATLFADKSLAAASDKAVTPEDPMKRKIKGDDKMAELNGARSRLMTVLASGAPMRAPDAAARAQVNYDCWVEQQEEGWQFIHIAACKDGFWGAVQVAENAMGAQPTQPPLAQQQAPQQPVTSERPFLVFFDWDRSDLTADARRVLNSVIARERNTTQNLHLIGYADRSGPDGYNVRLSQRRADAVKTYLVNSGIASFRLSTEARGERDPRVQTADGVRERQNRRVAINLLSQGSRRPSV